jgi:hypothetical protein
VSKKVDKKRKMMRQYSTVQYSIKPYMMILSQFYSILFQFPVSSRGSYCSYLRFTMRFDLRCDLIYDLRFYAIYDFMRFTILCDLRFYVRFMIYDLIHFLYLFSTLINQSINQCVFFFLSHFLLPRSRF